MKLKNITVVFEYVLVVDDNDTIDQQIYKAQTVLKDVVRDLADSQFDINVDKCTRLPYGWNEQCLPYGGTDDSTIGDILKGMAQPSL
jgi:hypothetical protein